MSLPNKNRGLIALSVVTCVAAAHGEKVTVNVRIVNRETRDTDYSYVIPGHWVSNSTANVACAGGPANVNCNGTMTTIASGDAAHQVSFSVRGATFSLALPDGRIAVVNCESKFAERFAGPRGNRRSCRMPIVDDIQVEFDGNKAKLKWPVSLDGKKIESETYKMLGVLTKAPAAEAQ